MSSCYHFISNLNGNLFGLVTSVIIFIVGIMIGRTSDSKYEISVIQGLLEEPINNFKSNKDVVREKLIKKDMSFLKQLNLDIDILDAKLLLWNKVKKNIDRETRYPILYLISFIRPKKIFGLILLVNVFRRYKKVKKLINEFEDSIFINNCEWEIGYKIYLELYVEYKMISFRYSQVIHRLTY